EREHRSLPDPNRLGAPRSGSLFQWLVSQDLTETDWCGRKNKRQPFRIPSVARFPCFQRFPSLERLKQAGPSPTRARIRATSHRTAKPRTSRRARTLPRPRADRVADRSGRVLRCSNCPFGLLVAGAYGLLLPCKQTPYQGFIKRPMFAMEKYHPDPRIGAPTRVCLFCRARLSESC